jgi:hypothetical protein
VEFSVHPPSPPNTYSHVREENSGSTRKFVEIYLLFMFITNLILALHTQSVNGLKEPFPRQWKEAPLAHAQQVTVLKQKPPDCFVGHTTV